MTGNLAESSHISPYDGPAGLQGSRVKMATEKRERKGPRRRVLKDGKIVSSTLHGAIDVRIRDLSQSGALIELPVGTVIPDTYGLLVVWESRVYPAVTRWRKGERLGMEFTGPPKLAALRKY
jgi:hypothetical protein